MRFDENGVTKVHPAVTLILSEHFEKYIFLLLKAKVRLQALQNDSGYETKLCQLNNFLGTGEIKKSKTALFFSCLFGKVTYFSSKINFFKDSVEKIDSSEKHKLLSVFFCDWAAFL